MTGSETVDVLAAAGLKLTTVIGGAVGSFISLNFFEGVPVVKRWSIFVSGTLLASFLAGPLLKFLELRPEIEVGIAVLLGLFGMSLAAQLMKIEWIVVFWAILAKFGIKKPGA